ARRYQLDYVLLDRRQRSGVELLDEIDADTTWSLVFFDDTSALYAQRASLRTVVDDHGLRRLGGGVRRLTQVTYAASEDSAVRSELRADLERAVKDSRWNATAHSMLANLAMVDNRGDEARTHLRAALAVDPQFQSAHYRLAMIALFEGRADDAIPELEKERRISGEVPGLHLALGMAHQQRGDRARAIDHYRAELRRDPGNAAAQARLDSLTSGTR
ncbi:MAG TPA: tetratricopeptide repeat protein, partial [Candidatus Eisenbacteria bacterium]|nr:tetratricopeptide repeat protein [Candidatus Eisenbacteria bacterium]